MGATKGGSELTRAEQDNLNTMTIERETRRALDRAILDLKQSMERAVAHTVLSRIIESQQAYIAKLRIAIASLENIRNAPLGGITAG